MCWASATAAARLIRAFSRVPVEYDESGAHGRLAQVILDQLAERRRLT
jgi:hypothetical protein